MIAEPIPARLQHCKSVPEASDSFRLLEARETRPCAGFRLHPVRRRWASSHRYAQKNLVSQGWAMGL